jgi:hypothetical protein
MNQVCMVYFRAGTCDLEAASSAFRNYGLTVTRELDHLVVGRPGSPYFRVRLSSAPHVRLEAVEIARDTLHEPAMRECEARFEIEIEDLDEALDEINTLMEIQGALQDTSRGYLFLPWNGTISKPWPA